MLCAHDKMKTLREGVRPKNSKRVPWRNDGRAVVGGCMEGMSAVLWIFQNSHKNESLIISFNYKINLNTLNKPNNIR